MEGDVYTRRLWPRSVSFYTRLFLFSDVLCLMTEFTLPSSFFVDDTWDWLLMAFDSVLCRFLVICLARTAEKCGPYLLPSYKRFVCCLICTYAPVYVCMLMLVFVLLFTCAYVSIYAYIRARCMFVCACKCVLVYIYVFKCICTIYVLMKGT